jgi:hypothetical protein
MSDSLQLTPVAQILGGLLLLTLGRRLFWVFVGVIGFFAGMHYGEAALAGLDEWLRLLIAFGIGLVAAVLALVLQRLAVGIAGAFVGGTFAMQLAPALGLNTGAGVSVAFFFGAVIAAVLLSILFDPALIVLSALMGAVMIADALALNDTLHLLVIAVLFVIGLGIQARIGPARRD